MKNSFNKQILLTLLTIGCFIGVVSAQIQNTNLLNEPPDISKDFEDYRNTYYLADSLASFNPETGKGTIKYVRYSFATRQAFNNMLSKLVPAPANEFPTTEYAVAPELPFSIEFISDRTVRIKTSSGSQFKKQEASLMLVNGVAKDARNLWIYSKIDEGHKYTSSKGSVVITEKPWHVKIYDAKGKHLIRSSSHP